MKFTIKHIGNVEEASLDLNKDLIVLAGHNNTGKTYVAYALYHLLTIKPKLLYNFLILNKSISNIAYNWEPDLISNHTVKELLNTFELTPNELSEEIQTLFIENLHAFFAIDMRHPSLKKVTLLLDTETLKSFLEKQVYKTDFYIEIGENTPEEFLAKKTKFSKEVNFHMDDYHPFYGLEFSDYLKQVIDYIIKHFLFSAYIAPAERSAINIFSKELSLVKNKTLEQLLQNNTPQLQSLLSSRINRYPKPIRDNLAIAEDLAALSKKKSPFAHLADELEQDILEGTIYITSEGIAQYRPHESQHHLEMHLSSSLVKSLSNIVFYLRHLAKPGDFIIIDEPELNLHPDNQRKIARFMGRLINEGFKIVISTHSDYIIKELNHLIMLSKVAEQEDLLAAYGYQSKQLIKSEQVQALLFKKGNTRPEDIPISESGFSITTIDDEIGKQDQLTEDIYFKLFEA